MRLVTFDAGNGPRLGALFENQIVDLAQAAETSGVGNLPADMLSLIQAGEDTWNVARQAITWAGKNPEALPEGTVFEADTVRLKAPLPNPPRLFGVGRNYKEHAEAFGFEVPDEPLLFAKLASAIIGPGEAVVIPHQSETVDYELELAVVLGRGGRHIPEAGAMQHVFGYTIMNDVSNREYQRKWSQWLVGKSFDTFAPMGPAIVTADEVPDPHDLPLTLSIDGEVLQDSNTSDMVFGIPTLIAFASSFFTLEAGDIFMTGSPPGNGATRTPPRWLRPGETMEMRIGDLGMLVSPVEAE